MLAYSMCHFNTRHSQRKQKRNIQRELEENLYLYYCALKKCQSCFILCYTKQNFFKILFRHLLPQFPIYLSHMAAASNHLLKFLKTTRKYTPKFQPMLLLDRKDKSAHCFQINIYIEHNSN